MTYIKKLSTKTVSLYLRFFGLLSLFSYPWEIILFLAMILINL
jgi:hypothetical protein